MAAVGLEENSLTLQAAGAGSAGTAVNGATLDMAGFDGVILFGTIATANAGNYLKAQQGEVSDGSDMADLAGTKVVADANGSIVAIDINRPKERYVRGVFIRAGANTATGDMYALRYKAGSAPTSNTIANVLKSLKLVSPAEGTP
jgi:hypothetical protein